MHHESEIVQMRSRMMPSARDRSTTPAWHVVVDIKLDLIVLEVELDQLKSKKHAALDTLRSSCLRCILLSSARFFSLVGHQRGAGLWS